MSERDASDIPSPIAEPVGCTPGHAHCSTRKKERQDVMARIAMLVDRMFEDSEFRVPFDRLRAAGHQVDIVGRKAGEQIEGKKGQERVTIEKSVKDVSERDYEALVIPGGYSPDHLRMDINAVKLTRTMAMAKK